MVDKKTIKNNMVRLSYIRLDEIFYKFLQYVYLGLILVQIMLFITNFVLHFMAFFSQSSGDLAYVNSMYNRGDPDIGEIPITEIPIESDFPFETLSENTDTYYDSSDSDSSSDSEISREIALYNPYSPGYLPPHEPRTVESDSSARTGESSGSASENIDANMRLNQFAYISNSNLNYDVLDVHSNRFILTNDAILDSSLLQSIRDLASEIRVETVSGNTITTLRLDTDVANLLLYSDNFSGDALFSGITESREAADLQFENEVRAIRTAPVVFNSPEFREMFEDINGTRALTILDVSPTSPSEINNPTDDDIRELEWSNQMRIDWRERIHILYSNQDPDMQPLPSWSEVPTRPSDPWAIEQWERDNYIRSLWAERLNGGYTQLNIVAGDAPLDDASYVSSSDDYYSTDWFDRGYQNMDDNKVSIDVFEEDDLGLARLFDEYETNLVKSFVFNPVIVYNDPDKEKLRILRDNRNKSAVYRWVNKVNGNYYIGSSTNLTVRLYTYYSIASLIKSNRVIDRALLKYGYSSFTLEILEYCNTENVLKREQFYIDNSKPIYNVAKIAGSTLGYKHRPDSIEKIKNFIFSDEVKEKKALSTINATNARKLSVTVKNVKTSEVIVYESLTSAGKALGVSKTAISQAIKETRLLKKTYAITIN